MCLKIFSVLPNIYCHIINSITKEKEVYQGENIILRSRVENEGRSSLIKVSCHGIINVVHDKGESCFL